VRVHINNYTIIRDIYRLFLSIN